MRLRALQVLLAALREVDARAVIVGFGPTGRSSSSRWRACPCSSPGLSSTGTGAPAGVRRRLGGAVDLPRGVRHGRRRVCGGGCPPIVAAPGAGRGGGRAGAGVPGRHGAAGGVHERRQRRAGGAVGEVLSLPDDRRAELREAARRACVERWSWSSVARRILAASTPE